MPETVEYSRRSGVYESKLPRSAGAPASQASPACPWRIADFDFYVQPSLDQKLVEQPAILGSLQDATNVLKIGPPGVGKTMLAVPLARATIAAGYRAYYTTAAEAAS